MVCVDWRVDRIKKAPGDEDAASRWSKILFMSFSRWDYCVCLNRFSGFHGLRS